MFLIQKVVCWISHEFDDRIQSHFPQVIENVVQVRKIELKTLVFVKAARNKKTHDKRVINAAITKCYTHANLIRFMSQ